ncbi:transglycosylase SLT domain-containing protein [Methylobacter sp. YRD-M1]|uniref:transglycosylase SLT domain-containing protein n=1 Tax=Methylobacter sp. YRD-M1 TaxID=2911520 RepID=UPI00227BA15A|nr:transglycosylase SLT domain-containing protein [Methylobacter sp. YRD-M1]WAK00615.1 transglycosylase SLT domain-containing protein [Methylobacter sp. YRD-M1]
MKKKYRCGYLLLMCVLTLPVTVSGNTLEQQRADFLRAEKLIAQGNDEAFWNVSMSLKSYPLYPYLHYQWLKNNLHQTSRILRFLSEYKDTRYAGLLRSQWLSYLAQHENWHEFLQHYQASGNSTLECQFYWAKYLTGDTQLALNEAKRLWTVAKSLPKECDALTSILIKSPLFTQELIWQRFELALRKDNVQLAEYLKRLLKDQTSADVWLKIHKKPELIGSDTLWISPDQQGGHIFAHAVDRMAKTDPELAMQIWDNRKYNFAIDAQTDQRLERRLALALAFKKNKKAYDRLSRLANVDAEVREWKVRAALLEQNWQHIADALAGLTDQERLEPRWQYWQARALAKAGDVLQAQNIYNHLAEDRSFYGFLAADTVSKPYQLADKPVFLSGNALETLAEASDFKIAQELDFLGRVPEAQRQWWFAIKKLPKERLMTAAKLAQQWQWNQVAIFTLAKAEYWDDMELRFPVNYLNEVSNNAYRHNLDPAVIFGLIRQESVFDRYAESPVGARGLMQIMPKTGQQIARDLRENWQSEASLFDPNINVKYGSFYYRQLLDRFNGHFALATAAYNAGPKRVGQWLPSGETVPADIWIETIPFKETRKYVSSVLAYIMIYQERMHRKALRIKDFMLDVLPG